MKRAFSFKRSARAIFGAFFRVSLPVAVVVFVTQDLTELAFASVFLFKWRVLAVKSRFWLANLRANMVDILLGLSMVELMDSAPETIYIAAWFGFYVLWALYIKKLSSYKGMILQAVIVNFLAYSALLYGYDSSSFGLLLAAVWFISYFTSRHVLSAFSEDHAPSLAHVWSLFSVQLAWVLWHFQVTYFFVEQAALISAILLASFSAAYAMSKMEEPNKARIRQLLITTSIMSLIIILQRVEAQI